MKPRPFYEVNPEVYLFQRKESPEEKVRQWALFELLSTYQLNIKSIEIEEPVRVGTRTHYADIVIFQDHIPYIVIECKRREDQSEKKSLQQAISYASILGAEFAGYTNGTVWHIKHKLGKDWITVPDIPSASAFDGTIELDSFLADMEDLKPIFYWLHRSVPPKHANQFISYLQRLFNGRAVFFREIHRDLTIGTDLLLRVIYVDPTCEKDYGSSNFTIACKRLIDYLQTIGYSEEELTSKSVLEGMNVREQLIVMKGHIRDLLTVEQSSMHEDIVLLRFIIMLLDYLDSTREAKKYVEIPEGLVNQFQAVLNPFFNRELNIRLPEKWDYLEDLRIYCSNSWKGD